MLDDPLLYYLQKKYLYDQTPIFTSGEIYLSSLMDSLICQAHYNHALTTVLTQLIVGDGGARTKDTNAPLDGDFSHVKTSNLY